MAPLIRLTLLGLYLALVLPLPPLAPEGLHLAMAVLVAVGLLLVLAVTSEQVELDDQGLRVGHPAWCRWLLRRGWSLQWSQVRGLTPVATSQGGRVYYVRNTKGAATLLPQRVAAFEDFLARFSRQTGLDTSSIGRISPAWTYQLLAALVVVLLISEAIALTVRPLA
ncbi:hypothetical protein KQ310_11065 [Synechococcus sp. CS-1328]|nr:hypothetical protein [Synechococcus sp. CS-1328]